MTVTISGSTGITGPNTDNDVVLNGVTVGLGGGSVSTNTVVGVTALNTNSTGIRATAIGYTALYNATGNDNTAVGARSQYTTSTGTANNSLGRDSLYSNTSGSSNQAIGVNALYYNTTGSYNTAIGDNALVSNTSAFNNTAVGYQAGYSTTTASTNTYIGAYAGYGANNTSVSSTGNICIGERAGYGLTTGYQNIFIGANGTNSPDGAGAGVTSGNYNVILGTYTGSAAPISGNGSNYIVLSDGAGNIRQYFDNNGLGYIGVVGTGYLTPQLYVNQANSYSSTGVAIMAKTSYSGDVGIPAAMFSKYDNNTTTSQVFTKFLVNNNGVGCGQINANGSGQAAFGAWSDITLKENITPLASQLENINKLEVIEFDYIQSEGGGHQIGFSAQNMQTVYPDAVGTREDGKLTLAGWNKTEARLVKAIQELSAEVAALKAKVGI